MASLDTLSDDPKYTIKAVSIQTGIRSVTLRAWERRHEILSPHRSDNRYRLYSERDVGILRWLKSRVDSGISISSAATDLRRMFARGEAPEIVEAQPSILPSGRTMPPARYSRELYTALVSHDEGRASILLREAMAAFDLLTVCSQIIVPCMVEIGDGWYNGKLRITDEHFASSFVRGKLLGLLQTFPVRRGAPYILVGCAPDEQHEIGAVMVAALLRSRSYRVEYLGPDVPVDDLVDYARFERPAMIILSATSRESALAMKSLQAKLSPIRPTPIFGYGGGAFQYYPGLKNELPGIYLGETLEKAVNKVHDLLQRKERVLGRARQAGEQPA
ncbi:MAG TPA: cobalamin-dependent protein [Anaerolineaceae bacterium]